MDYSRPLCYAGRRVNVPNEPTDLGDSVWEHAMKNLISMTAVLLSALVMLAAWQSSASGEEKAPAGKIFELRTYTTNPGKLDALNARFRDHTRRLFKKHGIEVVGFWTPVEGEQAKNTLVYMVAFPSLEAQKKAWDDFKADPEWQKAKADSEVDGVLVKHVDSKNLTATDYSPIR